jgi:hypothetical protein
MAITIANTGRSMKNFAMGQLAFFWPEGAAFSW